MHLYIRKKCASEKNITDVTETGIVKNVALLSLMLHCEIFYLNTRICPILFPAIQEHCRSNRARNQTKESMSVSPLITTAPATQLLQTYMSEVGKPTGTTLC